MIDTLIAIVLFLGVVVLIYKWLEKRNESKSFSPGFTVDPERFAAEVENLLLENDRATLIALWSGLIIKNGGNYVPPTLGDDKTDQQIAEKVVELRLGGRP